MKHLPIYILLSSTLCLGACTTVIREPVVVRPVASPVVIRQAPPLIQEVRSAPPGPGYAWVPGHWTWGRDQWVWQSGHWYQGSVRPMPPIIVEQITVVPSPRHYWVPGHWSWRNGEWEWRNGRWNS
jgi:hypothetical protein